MMGGKKHTFEIKKIRILVFGIVLLFILPANLVYLVLSLVAISSIFLGLEYVEEDWRRRRMAA